MYFYKLFVIIVVIGMLLRFDWRLNSSFAGTEAHVHSSLSLISLKDTNGYYWGI